MQGTLLCDKQIRYYKEYQKKLAGITGSSNATSIVIGHNKNELKESQGKLKQESLICDNNKLILLASLSDSLEYIPESIERRDKVKQDSYKKPNYVQISVDSYSHLMGLEDQIKNLEDEVKDLNEQLSAAHDEITTKENVVKQHAKVTEDVVSAEDKASYLDDAIKECMWQIRNLKEKHTQNVYDVVVAKMKQWDKLKLKFDAKDDDDENELGIYLLQFDRVEYGESDLNPKVTKD
ncbi:filament-like plant protein 4 [Tanacetum coccineum]